MPGIDILVLVGCKFGHRLHDLMRPEYFGVNRSRTYSICCEAHMTCRKGAQRANYRLGYLAPRAPTTAGVHQPGFHPLDATVRDRAGALSVVIGTVDLTGHIGSVDHQDLMRSSRNFPNRVRA